LQATKVAYLRLSCIRLQANKVKVVCVMCSYESTANKQKCEYVSVLVCVSVRVFSLVCESDRKTMHVFYVCAHVRMHACLHVCVCV
jgi:hypothetical protein